jgi:hypothetical protein
VPLLAAGAQVFEIRQCALQERGTDLQLWGDGRLPTCKRFRLRSQPNRSIGDERRLDTHQDNVQSVHSDSTVCKAPAPPVGGPLPLPQIVLDNGCAVM